MKINNGIITEFDSKEVTKIRMRFGADGYFVYVAIQELLYRENNHSLERDYDRIASVISADPVIVKGVVEQLELFELSDGCFMSKTINEHFELKRKLSEAKAKGANARWAKNHANASSEHANASPSYANASSEDANASFDEKSDCLEIETTSEHNDANACSNYANACQSDANAYVNYANACSVDANACSKKREEKEIEEKETPPILNNIPLLEKEEKEKEEEKKVQKEEREKVCSKPSLEDRIKLFIQSVQPYSEKYGQEAIDDFCAYWTEHSPNARTFRMEREKTFDIGRRLGTWAKNNSMWRKKPIVDLSKYKIDWYKVLRWYNGLGLVPIGSLSEFTDDRKMAYVSVYDMYNNKDDFITALADVKKMVGVSYYLKGGNKINWRADFLWLFKRENFINVKNGKYKDKQ